MENVRGCLFKLLVPTERYISVPVPRNKVRGTDSIRFYSFTSAVNCNAEREKRVGQRNRSVAVNIRRFKCAAGKDLKLHCVAGNEQCIGCCNNSVTVRISGNNGNGYECIGQRLGRCGENSLRGCNIGERGFKRSECVMCCTCLLYTSDAADE